MEQINQLIQTRNKIQDLYKELNEALQIEKIIKENSHLKDLKVFKTKFKYNNKNYEMIFIKPKNQNFTIFQRNYIFQTQILNKKKSQLKPEFQQINQHNLNEISKIFILEINEIFINV